MYQNAEQRAREQIDAKLTEAGWIVQHRTAINFNVRVLVSRCGNARPMSVQLTDPELRAYSHLSAPDRVLFSMHGVHSMFRADRRLINNSLHLAKRFRWLADRPKAIDQ